MYKIAIKTILRYVSYFLAIAGAVTVIWKVALYFDDKNDKTSTIETKLSIVIENQVMLKTNTDSMIIGLTAANKNLTELTAAQNALRNSYVRYLVNDKALTKDDFLKFMEGLQWELKKNDGTTLLEK